MNAGIDFGTSSCSIGVWQGEHPVLLKLEGDSTLLPSALHSARANLPTVPIDEQALKKAVAGARRRQAERAATLHAEAAGYCRKLAVEQLENHARGRLLRSHAQVQAERRKLQGLDASLYFDSETTFGEAAIRQHQLDPQGGYFVKSPKSFLGADIKQQHIDLFCEIITRMLAHIRNRAEAQVATGIDAICLGRPVRFHGLRGDEGDRQAISILERAAIAAGFEYVEFMYEPIAAALDFERRIDRDMVALVLDAGGGTTDCSMVRVGPSFRDKISRGDCVLGYAGDRVGGSDIDIKLSMRTLMPCFGKDSLLASGLPIPSTVFWNAVSVNDVNALADFSSQRTGQQIRQLLADAVDKQKVARLLALHSERLAYRLNRSAELAKIDLSDHEATSVSLSYIESGLAVPVSRADLRDAIERELGVFVNLMREVQAQSRVEPDVIYVTGGTARSPIIEECIRAHFGGVRIVVGDLFGSVTSGLATWAHRIFR
jgi:hypothetical chaperone protein